MKINSLANKIIIGLVIILFSEILINGYFTLKKNSFDFRKAFSFEKKKEETVNLEPEINATENQAPEEPVIINNYLPRRIDGVLVSPETPTYRPLAVMVDNMLEGRPAAGLSKADLVYEAVAESEITRFLAIFASGEEVPMIGPVRSARPYYLDWAEEYSPVYAHCGGSPQALSNLKQGQYNVFNLEQFSNEKYFWRNWAKGAPHNYAPHNLYTSTTLLNQFLIDENITGEINYSSWLFKDDSPLESRPAAGEEKNPLVLFSGGNSNYKVQWKYDREKNDYLRYQKNAIHEDMDGSPIRAKNVVVQYVKTIVLDSYGRLATQTVGTGDALIFRDGTAVQGTWNKPKKGERTKFFDAEGNEIQFNRGATWIEAVPTNKSVTY